MKGNILTKHLLVVVAILLTVATSTGCRSHRHLNGNGNTDKTAAADRDRQENSIKTDSIADNSVHNYCANFQTTVEGVKVNGQIRMVHDSIIWVSVSKVVELGRAMLTPSGAKLYVNIANKYYDGDYSTLSKRWGIDIDFRTVEALLLANLPPSCQRTAKPQQEGQKVTLVFRQTSEATGEQRQVTVTKETDSQRIERTEIISNSTSQTLACSYTATTNAGNVQLPSTIDLNLNSKSFNVSTRVALTNIRIGQSLSFPFSIPSRYSKF